MEFVLWSSIVLLRLSGIQICTILFLVLCVRLFSLFVFIGRLSQSSFSRVRSFDLEFSFRLCLYRPQELVLSKQRILDEIHRFQDILSEPRSTVRHLGGASFALEPLNYLVQCDVRFLGDEFFQGGRSLLLEQVFFKLGKVVVQPDYFVGNQLQFILYSLLAHFYF